MESAIIYIIFFVVIISLSFIRKVPTNTVLIIDRHSHYLKTKRRGFYFFNPATDKITTEIAKRHITKQYIDNFETHDGYIARIAFTVEYHAENIEAVLQALASARRSVDDVMNGAIYWAARNLSLSDFKNTSIALMNEARPILISESGELEVKIDQFYINNITPIPSSAHVPVFRPHTSSYSLGPIQMYK
ncbi:MAG: hypothetical protein IJ215_03640 [Clostridia bacterium]|nr:hypothetical protein [Clostridia bacterium]